MREIRRGPLFLAAIGALLAGYLMNRLFALYAVQPADMLFSARWMAALDGIGAELRSRPLYLSTGKAAWTAGAVGFASIWLGYLYYLTTVKNFRPGEEHGSSKWGTPRDIAPLLNPEPDLNIPLSATESINLCAAEDFEHDRNNNVLVVGGPGSGKTHGIMKPELMQLHSSYVITDPKGTLLPDVGHMLTAHGYTVRAFNSVDFSRSLHYNPLAYIRKESDILRIVNVLIENTSGPTGVPAGDMKFWVDCERLLYTACIAFLWQEAPPEDCNLPTLIEMLDLCQVKEEDEDYVSPTDVLFDELSAHSPDCLAVRQYHKFKKGAGKSMKSILLTCAARMAPFDISELREITRYDELHLDEIGDRKTALFLIMSDTDSTYTFLIAMILYQMFILLEEKADTGYGGTLPFRVRCLFDEFANIGRIPDFDRKIATIRSRGISATILLQSITQLNAVYKDNAETIIDCCDTLVFLGGKSTKTTKEVSEMIGKSTIDTRSISESKGTTGSWSRQDSTLARDLIDPAEIGRLHRSECLVLITGLPPFRSRKYPTAQHPRYHEITDGGAPSYDIRAASHAEKVVVVEYYDLSELNALA